MIPPPPASRWSSCLALTLLLAHATTAGALVQARDGGGEWNTPRVRALIERAIARRASWSDDSLFDYQAHARGHLYFLFDLGATTQRNLVKADQLALNLYWKTPNETRQVIIGRKEKKALPTSIEYHLDHLTVVMDNFGDRISMGEGSEVRDALHPAAGGALAFYEYRLVDSLTLLLPDREISVNKVEVRPRDPSDPGIVGAIYLDRSSADIVRMEFTFTAASYLDPQLDYINVRLENGLWAGLYWLPFRQGLELRRELRVLDFPAGGIIRAEFQIGDYRFNEGLPDGLFQGPTVTHLPARALADYEFDEGLYDALDPKVATSPPSLEEIREEATRIVARSYLQRAYDLRLAVPGVSSIARFRRAEGLYLGPGLSRGFRLGSTLYVTGGYAFGSDRVQLSGRLRVPMEESFELVFTGDLNRAPDVSPWPASSGLVGSVANLVDGEDYRDQYWASGGKVEATRRRGATRMSLSVAWESWESAELTADQIIDRSYRPVRAVDDGEALILAGGAEELPGSVLEEVGGTSWRVRIEGAARDLASDFDFLQVALQGSRFWPTRLWGIGFKLSAQSGGLMGGRSPAQRLFPVGGRGTVRGYSFHSFVGDLYGAGTTELSRGLFHPLLKLVAFADIAWVGLEGGSNRRAVAVWNQVGSKAGPSRGPLVGVGGGVGFLFDIVRIELARGLESGGIWELVVLANSQFWGWL